MNSVDIGAALSRIARKGSGKPTVGCNVMELGRESVEVAFDQGRLKDGLNRQRRAFTLVGLLAGLSLPVFSKAEFRALQMHSGVRVTISRRFKHE